MTTITKHNEKEIKVIGEAVAPVEIFTLETIENQITSWEKSKENAEAQIAHWTKLKDKAVEFEIA